VCTRGRLSRTRTALKSPRFWEVQSQLMRTGQSAHYQRAPCFGGKLGAGQAAGLCPRTPGFSALVPLPMRALCRQTDERGCRNIPPESVEATESALGLLPSIALSSAQSGFILRRREKRRIFAVGSKGSNLTLVVRDLRPQYWRHPRCGRRNWARRDWCSEGEARVGAGKRRGLALPFRLISDFRPSGRGDRTLQAGGLA
jgi:hypothetical protein